MCGKQIERRVEGEEKVCKKMFYQSQSIRVTFRCSETLKWTGHVYSEV